MAGTYSNKVWLKMLKEAILQLHLRTADAALFYEMKEEKIFNEECKYVKGGRADIRIEHLT